jgi:hypothetical protein
MRYQIKEWMLYGSGEMEGRLCSVTRFMMLLFSEGESYTQIGKVMSCSKQAVHQRIQLAMKNCWGISGTM